MSGRAGGVRPASAPVATGGAARAPILAVDDRPENLLALEAVLAPLGEEIVTARSGQEALRRLLERDFAVILLDVEMPTMDGYETAAMIRSRERLRRTPIVFLSAIHVTEPQIFRGYEAGAVDYIVKPVSPEILRSKVRSFADLYRLSERLREIERRETQRERERAETLEKQVRARTEDLARANRDLETMLHVASHDLKEPLHSIESFSTLVLEQHAGGLDEKGREFLGRVVRAARRMRGLLDDLLTVARARRLEPPAATVDGAEVVAAALEALAAKIGETGARVRVLDGLPRLRAARTWAVQAVSNLVSNALKFTRTGDPPEIEIGPYDGPEGVGIAVRDRGPGIPAEMGDGIFDLFRRGVGREVEGTGAGLAIVKAIAERHGGRALARNRPTTEGGGAEFVVTFGPPAAAREAGTVLLVDDDDDYLTLAREFLAAEGLVRRVEVARSADEALSYLRKRNSHRDAPTPALVLLDLNMPGRSGFDLLAEMRADPALQAVPVVVVTASHREEDRRRSLAEGAVEFLPKTALFDRFRDVAGRYVAA